MSSVKSDPRRTVRRLGACALALAAAACGGETSTQPSTPADPLALWKAQPNDRIVFMSRADAPDGELYVLDKSGAITRLTNNRRHENNPALSPDGRRVAFHAGDEGNATTWEIHILDLTSGLETRLTHNGVLDGHPDWSPDGRQIVFASFRDDAGNPAATADIHVMDVAGTTLRRLTVSPYEDNDPEWSPDGSAIVFKSSRRTRQPAREEIYVMDADGSNPRRLTTTSGWESDHDPSWRPDGQEIVFERFEGVRPWFDLSDPDVFARGWAEFVPWNIYRVGLNGAMTRVTDEEHIGALPVYGSGGDTTLFLRLNLLIQNGAVSGADHRLILVNPGGGGEQQLIPDDRHTPTLEYFDW